MKNGQKWLNIEFAGKCQKNGVGIAWSIFLLTDNIATAPNDNIFVSKSRDGAKRLPMSRHKWWKMAINGIFSYFWPFFPIRAWLWATPLSHFRFLWLKCYQWVLFQWNLWRDSYSLPLPPHFPTICQKIKFLAIVPICACIWATPWPHLCFYWQKCYHWVLLQWYLHFCNDIYIFVWVVCTMIQNKVILRH